MRAMWWVFLDGGSEGQRRSVTRVLVFTFFSKYRREVIWTRKMLLYTKAIVLL